MTPATGAKTGESVFYKEKLLSSILLKLNDLKLMVNIGFGPTFGKHVHSVRCVRGLLPVCWKNSTCNVVPQVAF